MDIENVFLVIFAGAMFFLACVLISETVQQLKFYSKLKGK